MIYVFFINSHLGGIHPLTLELVKTEAASIARDEVREYLEVFSEMAQADGSKQQKRYFLIGKIPKFIIFSF